MYPVHISKIINKQLGRNALYPVIKNWHKIVGTIIFKVAVPLKVKRGTLIVGVKNHQWLQELGFSKETMLEKISKHTNQIKDIMFILKSDLTKKAEKESAEKKAKETKIRTTLTSRDINFIKNVVTDVKDKELKNIFENILKTKLSNPES